jgi:hypothetical protein
LWNKIPHDSVQQTQKSSLAKREKELEEFIKKNESFSFVSMEEPQSQSQSQSQSQPPPTKSIKEEKKQQSVASQKKKHIRKRQANTTGTNNEKQETEDEDEDAKRERDIKERDEFAQRLLKKDEEKTKKLMQAKVDPKEIEESKKRRELYEKFKQEMEQRKCVIRFLFYIILDCVCVRVVFFLVSTIELCYIIIYID